MKIWTNGCFDVLHIGHLLYFNEAKNKNRKLIVSVTSDKFVNKGDGRPVFNIKDRKVQIDDHLIIFVSDRGHLNTIEKMFALEETSE